MTATGCDSGALWNSVCLEGGGGAPSAVSGGSRNISRKLTYDDLTEAAEFG
jgi:hypothetical protein